MIPWLLALAATLAGDVTHQRTVALGKATVRLIQVLRPDSSCSARLEFRRPGKPRRILWSGNAEAVGLVAGLFIPDRQPSAGYLTVVKAGDYEGLLLFVEPDGSLTTLPGGWFWIDEPHRLLFAISASDDPETVVVDLRTLRRVGEDIAITPEYFYRDGNRVFLTGQGLDGERAFEFDFTRRRFVRTQSARTRWTRIPWDFDLNHQPECGSR